MPYLIETYLFPTMGLVCVMLVPLPRLRDLRLTGMLAAAGTKTSFIDEGICRGMFFHGCMGLFERLWLSSRRCKLVFPMTLSLSSFFDSDCIFAKYALFSWSRLSTFSFEAPLALLDDF